MATDQMPGGYAGKILRVDLSGKKTTIEKLDSKSAGNFSVALGLSPIIFIQK